MKSEKYDHKNIEKKWQDEWAKLGLYKTPNQILGKENFYTLVEFSYPSGNLHVGHWYAFSVPDIFARYKRMNGFNVLYPMGFDAFGLPAENAAIKLGEDPKTWTYKHMEKMRDQLRSMGAMFDWEREVVSCDPEYYKWTQWMFNQFYKNDLAYRAITKVNWCPKDQTILANEQVVDGKCERCGTDVIQRNQEQWMLKITKYADALIDDLDALDWPTEIKAAQKNWIGRSEGSEIEFQIKNSEEKIKVFTTRADTLFGVTYVVLAPEHALVQKILSENTVSNKNEILEYIETTKKKSELDRQQSKEKTGIEMKGISAINPANGEEVPVWIADYVLAGYGTGAVMAVPAHDERDYEFADKYKLIASNYVVKPEFTPDTFTFYGPHLPEGVLFNSGEFDGLTSADARKKITEKVGGKLVKTYRLRDWGISRQRYWGCPIPIVYDPEGNAHAIGKEHLPWLLPTDVDHTPDGTAPLARSAELLERTEKIFGKGWKPEVETMDTFVDSSWYFYRYLDNKNNSEFAAKEIQKKWMPIDLYMGGAEHTTMHLLYSRFWTKALFDLGFVTENEAYKVRRNRGLILGPDGNKMSKSKGNVIDPDEIVQLLGADTIRMYLAFMGPYGVTTNYPWDPNGVVGVHRFLERVWKISEKATETTSEKDEEIILHKTIKGMTEDIEEHKYNTAISKMMILMNAWDKQEKIAVDSYKMLLKLLSPFAPHITEELWHELGEKNSIHLSDWPSYDAEKIIDEEVKIMVQVNGKVRGEFTTARDGDKTELENTAKELKNVVPWIQNKEIKNIIYVSNKLINIVVL